MLVRVEGPAKSPVGFGDVLLVGLKWPMFVHVTFCGVVW